MSDLIIVAIPSEDDYIHKISSEKIPHLTLLFLGEVSKVENFAEIVGFTAHATGLTLRRFGLEVDRRTVLGDDSADVLCFSTSEWSGFRTIREFRSNLLKNDNIRKAYDSVEQFPEWIPHITLGFPKTPAKPDERDYPGISYVNFDRIAVWDGEYQGIVFPLKAYEWDSVGMAMDNIGEKSVENILAHFGKKGMKWGVRNKSSGPQGVTVKPNRFGGKKLKTSGGKGHPAHADAIRARTQGQIGKKSGVKALSDADLQNYTKRLTLEANVNRLNYGEKNMAKKFVARLMGKSGKSPLSDPAKSGAKKIGRRVIQGAVVAAA